MVCHYIIISHDESYIWWCILRSEIDWQTQLAQDIDFRQAAAFDWVTSVASLHFLIPLHTLFPQSSLIVTTADYRFITFIEKRRAASLRRHAASVPPRLPATAGRRGRKHFNNGERRACPPPTILGPMRQLREATRVPRESRAYNTTSLIYHYFHFHATPLFLSLFLVHIYNALMTRFLTIFISGLLVCAADI